MWVGVHVRERGADVDSLGEGDFWSDGGMERG